MDVCIFVFSLLIFQRRKKKEWHPPTKIEELFSAASGNKFASINAPTSGARRKIDLPRGKASVQFYSLCTPNGQKPAILFEELAECCGFEYDAHLIDIMSGSQFDSGFVEGNPNSKIPMCIDYGNQTTDEPIRLFESASIILYFAEKYQKFIFANHISQKTLRAELMNWVFWQMAGQGPITGNFGHFFCYAPADKCEARDYGVSRYGMDTMRYSYTLCIYIKKFSNAIYDCMIVLVLNRYCDQLDKHLEHRTYMLGEEYSIVDIVCFPWFQYLRNGYINDATGMKAGEFLTIERYEHACRWADKILERKAVKRGMVVCDWKSWKEKPWLESS